MTHKDGTVHTIETWDLEGIAMTQEYMDKEHHNLDAQTCTHITSSRKKLVLTMKGVGQYVYRQSQNTYPGGLHWNG